MSVKQTFYIMKVDIKTAAKSHGVSLIELSNRLGVSRQSVHYYCEQGDKNPVAQLERIADAIGCKVSEFFTDEEEPANEPAPTNAIICPHCGKAIRIEKGE